MSHNPKKRSSESAFPDEDPEFQVAPMIDILLVLMTFFMSITSTEILKTKTKMNLDLPVAKDSKKKDKAQNEITINVGWDDVAKKGLIEFEEKTLNEPTDITPIILSRKGNQTDFRAVIRASQDVPYSFVQEVMFACAGADVGNITFSVFSKNAPKGYDK
jgi:biopolymer transport protein ExbD